jgi:hypothetical protein
MKNKFAFRCLAAAAAFSLNLAVVHAADAPATVTLKWLDGAAPAAPESVSWGVPWPKGALQKTDSVTLRTADGKSVPVQTWTLASWPDGSVKWSGNAIVADSSITGPLELSVGAGSAAVPAPELRATETADTITINTGGAGCVIKKSGEFLFETLTVSNRVVAQNARLIAILEDRSQFETNGILREEEFTSLVQKVTLEQSGPVRAVVKIDGVHAAKSGRKLLPFSVRLYFFAGTAPMRIVHSFIYDGDSSKDFIKGLGLAFTVPFKEELHNRHFRFVGEGEGVWDQPVRMLPGYRGPAGPEVTRLYDPQLNGQRLPNLADLSAQARNALITVPIWGDARLSQSGPNSFSIEKRTTAASSWLHVMDGHRSLGLAVLGDVSGGIAVGLKHFWEKNPSSIEITGAATDAGEMKIWFWSPDAPAMDMRRYDDIPHGLNINYEDWKPGWGDAYGTANTTDLTLWPFAAIPSNAQLVSMAKETTDTPILVCSPEYYHSLQVFGHWSLPDTSTPTLAWVEGQVQGLVDFYHGQVEERSWYGFWDFGDIMHNYDFGRHEWRYDVGGWAWANTELMPDMLLWYSFLRTGRADLFRFAEAMTRHTSEVDVYHIGPFAPLGSRHNVNHFGDGAKQPRASHDGIKEFYYFLAADDRIGDLMHEQLDADKAYTLLQRYNGSHYVPTADGQAQLNGNPPAPFPANLPPRSDAPRGVTSRFALEWLCYSMNWTVEWERTGDTQWHDLVLADMKAMAAGSQGGRFAGGGYFDVIFGGPENLWEMEPMYPDAPDFWRAWADTCEYIGRNVNGGQMTAPRMLAYAAYKKQSPELGLLAWQKLIGNALPPPARPAKVSGPNLVRPVTDPAFLGGPVGWQLHGVASVQWALNAIETEEMAKPWLPLWEKSR